MQTGEKQTVDKREECVSGGDGDRGGGRKDN